MSIRTFWIIFIKILGVWLLCGSLTVIVQLFATLYSTAQMRHELLWDSLLYLISITGLFLLILWLFIFKATWFVNKLKLERGFTEERIDLNIKSSTMLKIAIIVISGLMLVEALPQFCRNTYVYIQQKNNFIDTPNAGWIIFDFVRGFLGYIMMVFNKPIAAFIERQASSQND